MNRRAWMSLKLDSSGSERCLRHVKAKGRAQTLLISSGALMQTLETE